MGEANALGGGDLEGPAAGPDAASLGPGDAGEGSWAGPTEDPATAQDVGGGDDVDDDAEEERS